MALIGFSISFTIVLMFHMQTFSTLLPLRQQDFYSILLPTNTLSSIATNNNKIETINNSPNKIDTKHKTNNQNHKKKNNITVAFATTIAYCPSGKANPANIYGVTDGPTILAQSIVMTQIRSNYNYKLYAIVHPSAVDCVRDYLHDFTILERDVPVHPNDVQTKEYSHLIKFGSGCCGAREFLKLHAYTLTEDIVVHMDYDVIMLQPIDELFDAMMSHDASNYNITSPRDTAIPKRVDVFFTRDYIQRSGLAMNEPLKFAVQGGFFIIRPNITLYQEMISILLRGNYNDKTGWENSRIGNFYGAAQIQGFLAYIYAELYPEHSVEINRCIYNTMVYDEPLDNHGKCRTGEVKCNDCRITPLEDIKLVHYAMCQDPWYCTLPTVGHPPERCRHVLTEWFRVRQGLDQQRGHVVPIVETNDWTLGYCKNGTYSPLQVMTQ